MHLNKWCALDIRMTFLYGQTSNSAPLAAIWSYRAKYGRAAVAFKIYEIVAMSRRKCRIAITCMEVKTVQCKLYKWNQRRKFYLKSFKFSNLKEFKFSMTSSLFSGFFKIIPLKICKNSKTSLILKL